MKKIILILSVGFLCLSGCSHLGKNDNAAMDADDTTSAQTSGADVDGGVGGTGQGLEKVIYYFDFDKSDVSSDDRASLSAHAQYLAQHPSAKILIEGHTDPRGSREYNVALGERRANTVAQILKSEGVKTDRIRVVSYGQEKLAVEGNTEDAYRLDRRAKIVYLSK